MPSPNDLINIISGSANALGKALPGIEKNLLNDILVQLKGADLDSSNNLKNSVKNLRLLSSIKGKLLKTILSPEYKEAVKEYLSAFKEIEKFQNALFKEAEKGFKPPAIGREIQKQSIDDVVSKLTEAGIGVNVGDRIADILRTNITSGTSYASLADQLRELIAKTDTPGVLDRYVKQIATDAANQYSAQYMKTVSDDLGYEWFRYGGKDITTTRPFCDAMTDLGYFHISKIPDLLAAKDLYYIKDGQRTKVPIYPKTGLPHGLIAGTDASNFFVRRGGYNCGHQIFPVRESEVPKKIVAEFKAGVPKKKAGAVKPPKQSEEDKLLKLAKELIDEGADWSVISHQLGFNSSQEMVGLVGVPVSGVFMERYKELIKVDLSDDTAIRLNAGATRQELPRVVRDAVFNWTSSSSKIRKYPETHLVKKWFRKAAGKETRHIELYRGESFRKDGMNEAFFNKIKSEYSVGDLVDFKKKFTVDTGGGRKELWDRTMLSFSYDRDTANEFANIGHPAYNKVMFIVKAKAGKKVKGMDISEISDFSKEFEVIVGNGNKYKVISKTVFSDDHIEIELEEQ